MILPGWGSVLFSLTWILLIPFRYFVGCLVFLSFLVLIIGLDCIMVVQDISYLRVLF